LASRSGEVAILHYWQVYGDALRANGIGQPGTDPNVVARISRRQAFQTTFGTTLDDFVGQFEAYRVANLPAVFTCPALRSPDLSGIGPLEREYCGREAPGEGPDPPTLLGYAFCVRGFDLSQLNNDQLLAAVSRPPGNQDYLFRTQNCFTTYRPATASPGAFVV